MKESALKIVVDKAFIIIILVYSAIKNSANGPTVYSTLNPETNSDSPSVKSNWARLVSASVETNHMNAGGSVGSRNLMILVGPLDGALDWLLRDWSVSIMALQVIMCVPFWKAVQ